jgi:hypothetical protein
MAERIEGLLAKVPGYRGYRAKEDRRDADRRVREHLTTAYGAQADRVERIARELSRQRRLADVGPVDELARSIRHLIDRIRTATYGYGGLFSDRDVDEAALDQLRRFDEGLLGGVDELSAGVTAVETAFNDGTDLAAASRAGMTTVQTLLARLDLRGEVIETAKPAPEESVLRVLETAKPAVPPPAFDLHERDAVSILGNNYLVDARLEVKADEQSFRLFRLSGGATDAWLYVPSVPDERFALVSSTQEPYTTGVAEFGTKIGETTYTIKSSGAGSGELIGVGGSAGRRAVSFTTLVGQTDPAQRAVVIDWGNERQVLVGKEVHPDDVEVFARDT